MPSESDHKYFAVIKFCTQVVDKYVEKRTCLAPKCTPINTLPLFAQFSCKHQKTCACKPYLCAKNQFQRRMKLILELFRGGTSLGLIPLGRAVEVNLDRVLRARDVVPSPKGFPSFRHNLYQHSAKRRVRYVSDSLAVGLHIQLELLIFRNFVFFDILQIHAGIFDRTIFIAAGDFNGYASVGQRALGLALREFPARC